MSNNRVFIFLDNQSVKQVCAKKTINVLNTISRISRLNAPKIRITTHCSPTIPNSILEKQQIEATGLTVVSNITYLKIGVEDEFLSHIRSFRRQIYVSLDEDRIIPEKITIDYNNIKFPVFITEDNLRCAICNKIGHLENQCHQAYHQPPNNHPLQQDSKIVQPNNKKITKSAQRD